MSAQEYLETLAAEHQKSVDDYRALQEAKEQERKGRGYSLAGAQHVNSGGAIKIN